VIVVHEWTVGELVETIGRKFRSELVVLQKAMFDDIGDYSAVPESLVSLWRPPTVRARSLVDRYTALTVTVSSMDLVAGAPADSTIKPGSVAVTLCVAGHHKLLDQPRTVPQVEADAWARAVFGTWAPHAYYRGPLTSHGPRPAALHYALYLDSGHHPRRPPSGVSTPHELLGAPPHG
jgi:hypothetical protein